MLAKYDGFCVECDQPYKAGEDITYRDGSWVHVDCPLVVPLTKYCPKCYTYASIDGSCLCE